MVNSLDRLSSELQATHDAIVRVLSSSEGNIPMDESFRSNAENLRRAINSCSLRVESVRRRHHHHGSRRNPRRGTPGDDASLSVAASESVSQP